MGDMGEVGLMCRIQEKNPKQLPYLMAIMTSRTLSAAACTSTCTSSGLGGATSRTRKTTPILNAPQP